jgi:Cu+-exporting ATPase
MITGESIPSEKSKGSKVIGGTINANGSMVIRVSKTGSETALWQIIKLIQEAQGRQAPVQRFADEVSAKFVPAVLALSAITFLSWIYLGAKLDFAVNSAVSVLVIACPCALGLATPTAIMVGTGMGAKKGILIKGGDSLETLCKVENVVFDKTGTLTKGSPQVTDVVPARGVSESQLLSIACALEEHSEHPLAKAVVQACGSRKIKKPRATKFKAIPGGGVEGLVSGKSAKVGSARWLLTRGVQADYEKISELENQGKTVVVVAIGKKAIGFLGIADSPREESKNAVSELSKMGLKVHLLTGDNKRTANAVAEEIGISKENVLSEVHPGEKAGKVMELKASSRGGVAMVGDGINDAPALASASVGIAMGSGTDVAIDSAGIVLMKSNPLDVARAIRLSRETLSTIKQNMFWALAYNVAAIPIAAGVLYPLTGYLLSPAIAGGAMALSSVSVVVNSLRLRSKKI